MTERVDVTYDEERWVRELAYQKQDAALATDLFGLLRKASHQLLRALPASAGSRTFVHPQHGAMTLDDWLVIYTDHVPNHIRQIEATHDAWRKRGTRQAVDPGTSLYRSSR